MSRSLATFVAILLLLTPLSVGEAQTSRTARTTEPAPTTTSSSSRNETASPAPTTTSPATVNETQEPTSSDETKPATESTAPSEPLVDETLAGSPTPRAPGPKENRTENRTDGAGTDPQRKPGRLTMQDGDVVGVYVRFRLDPATCSLHDFHVYSLPVLALVQLPATGCQPSPGGGPGESGPGQVSLRGPGVDLRVHDAPNALLQFRARDGNVSVLPAPGIVLNETERGFEFTVGNLSGTLFSKNATLEPVDEGLEGRDGSLMVHPASGTSPERRAVFDAIQRGRVAGKFDLLSENGTLVTEFQAYDDVRVNVRRHGNDRFDFTVDAELPDGRVFIIDIDPATWDPARLRIDYADVDEDGDTHPVRIREAGSLEEVLEFDPAKGAVYFVYEDAEGWHAAVAVPHFSVHVFQMVGLPLEVVPLLLYGVVIGGMFFVAGGVGIVLERRQRVR